MIDQMNEQDAARYFRRLLTALGACALVNVAIIAFVISTGESLERAFEASGLHGTSVLFKPTASDSITPMAMAYLHQQKSGDLYSVILVNGVKFQYPPSSLLLMKLLPEKPAFNDFVGFWAVQSKLSLIAILVTIMCSAALWLKISSINWSGTTKWYRSAALGSTVAIAVLGVTYYPLIKGHLLGQIQIFLGALVALALLLQEFDRHSSSGFCIGLCCLIKPQFAILVLWAILRRQKRFLLGFGIVVLLGLCLAIIEFGLHNHFQYLKVLQFLSRTGEAYGPNQSVNGLLNRFLENGDAVAFQHFTFAPYHPVVYYSTMASSIVILALAFFLPAASNLKGRSLDLAVVICAATMASPIAWEHHYGAFFPVFAIGLVAANRSRRASFLLLVSYAFVANELIRTDLVFANRWIGILGSHIFFGALLLFGFLLIVRLRGTLGASSANEC